MSTVMSTVMSTLRRNPRSPAGTPVVAFIVASVIVCFVSALAAQESAPARLDVDAVVAGDAAIVIKANGAALAGGLRGTPAGRLLTHPDVERALGVLPGLAAQQIRAGTADLAAAIGMGVGEILSLFRGDVAIFVSGIRRERPPVLVAAIELGAAREEIRKLVARLESLAREQGIAVTPSVVDGVEVRALPAPGGGPPIHYAELGSHLVVAIDGGDGEALPAIARRFAAAARAPRADPGERGELAALEMESAVTRRGLFIGIDHRRFIDALRPRIEPQQEEEMVFWRALDFLGLSGVQSLGVSVGFHDEDLEVRVRVRTTAAPSGVLGAVVGGIGPAADAAAMLARVPARASAISVARVDAGKAVLDVIRGLERSFPDAAGAVSLGMSVAEDATGLELPEDIAALKAFDVCAFTLAQRAGGLADDAFYLVRAVEFASIERLLGKLSRQGAGFHEMPFAGRTLRSAIIEFDSEGLAIAQRLLSWTSLDDEWVLAADSPQALRRYLDGDAGGPALTADAPFHRLASETCRGAAGVVVRRDSNGLAGYNTVVTLLNLLAPLADDFIRPFGVDVGLLPDGETFLETLRDSSVRWARTENGLDLHARGLMSNASSNAPAAVAAASIIAGFLVPTLIKSRGAANIVACQNNLREIAKMSLLWADTKGAGFLPHSGAGGVSGLQMLADHFGEDIPAALFYCRHREHPLPERGADGRLRLTPETSSYELTPLRLRSDEAGILCWDARPHPDGSRNVVSSDGSVRRMSAAEFDEAMAELRRRLEEAKRRPSAEKRRQP